MVIFIRHEADTERATHVDDLWCAGGCVGTVWCIDSLAVAPGLAVIGRCDGVDGEKSTCLAFENSHQFGPANSRYAGHTCRELEVSES